MINKHENLYANTLSTLNNTTKLNHISIYINEYSCWCTLNSRDLIKHDHRSKCYTTDINELIEVK